MDNLSVHLQQLNVAVYLRQLRLRAIRQIEPRRLDLPPAENFLCFEHCYFQFALLGEVARRNEKVLLEWIGYEKPFDFANIQKDLHTKLVGISARGIASQLVRQHGPGRCQVVGSVT